MKEHVSFSFPILFSFFIATTLGFLSFIYGNLESIHDRVDLKKCSADFDEWGSDFKFIRTDLNGKVTEYIQADYFKCKNNFYFLDSPKIIVLKEDSAIRTTAINGTIKTDWTSILLEKKAHLHWKEFYGQDTFDIYSQQLLINPRNGLVQSNTYTEIFGKNFSIRCTKMNYNHETHQLEIFNSPNTKLD